jgi:hypothetical protein
MSLAREDSKNEFYVYITKKYQFGSPNIIIFLPTLRGYFFIIYIIHIF